MHTTTFADTDTDFSESEAVLQAGTKKYPQSEPETGMLTIYKLYWLLETNIMWIF